MQATSYRAGETGANRRLTAEEWGVIWFEQLASFHRVADRQSWQFTEQHVIDFLRSRLKKGVPTPTWRSTAMSPNRRRTKRSMG